MAEIEIVEPDYAADCFELTNYDKDLKLINLIEKLIDAHLSEINSEIEAEAGKQAQRLLEDIVLHTTAEMRGKDVHICFWDSQGTLFAWKTIPEAELVKNDDEEEEEETA